VTGTAVYLEGFVDESHAVWRTVVAPVPFRIGRRSDADLVLMSNRVSHLHAEIHRGDDALLLVDLDSTNGTFVNGERIGGPHRLEDGDIVHFGDQEFRLVVRETGPGDGDVESRDTPTRELSSVRHPARLFERSRQLRAMLLARRVHARFQPIVRLGDVETVGYEILGRGMLGEEEASAGLLFQVAEALELEVELSTMLRERGIEDAARLPGSLSLFVNTHPSELRAEREFLLALEDLRTRFPERRLVLEIHERAVADLASFARLRSGMADLGIEIAFDDFGTGQARLLELIDVEPSVVKFDRAWITGLDHASPRRLRMVERLVRMVTEMDVTAAAEGVETAGEAEVCAELGFGLAQGYYFGRPETAGDV
jgi:EAL domain-containing protein (putative c-di-GMP-specific phosphodiesterase class I)